MTRLSHLTARCCDRLNVRMPVEIVVEADGAKIAYPASTVDFTRYGARVQTKVALVPGEQVSFIWHGLIPQALQGTVVWAAPGQPSQLREAGLKFLQPLPTGA